MSFDVTRWPLPDDIDRYQRDLKVPRDAIVRDIARLVTVAQIVHEDELNDDLVLTGGMAMRLRGSPRFTMSDTDTSRRTPEAPDRDRLAEAFTVDQSELTVSPGDVLGWKPGKKLVIAGFCDAPERIRTSDLRFRRRTNIGIIGSAERHQAR